MWIEMLKTYSGIAGLFLAAIKYDLPEATLDNLPKDSFKSVPSPWYTRKTKQATTKADKQARPGKSNYKTKGS